MPTSPPLSRTSSNLGSPCATKGLRRDWELSGTSCLDLPPLPTYELLWSTTGDEERSGGTETNRALVGVNNSLPWQNTPERKRTASRLSQKHGSRLGWRRFAAEHRVWRSHPTPGTCSWGRQRYSSRPGSLSIRWGLPGHTYTNKAGVAFITRHVTLCQGPNEDRASRVYLTQAAWGEQP